MGTQARRLKLHNKLCEILGSNHVYYQPPESVKMVYPCIVYHRNTTRKFNADNKKYLSYDSYDVTFICKDPDSDIPDAIEDGFSMIRRETRYTAEGLYHDPFYLYYQGGN